MHIYGVCMHMYSGVCKVFIWYIQVYKGMYSYLSIKDLFTLQ